MGPAGSDLYEVSATGTGGDAAPGAADGFVVTGEDAVAAAISDNAAVAATPADTPRAATPQTAANLTSRPGPGGSLRDEIFFC